MFTAIHPSMWRQALRNRDSWSQALRIGLPVGLLQVVVNQGDHWLLGPVTAGVVLKSIASPAISTGIALVAATASARTEGKKGTP